ncbi:haloacid dehalogenase superfamily, subfamily IA, variant 3 with third motif having DD or ED [Methanolobus vulcani]|jgi:HAD superfamily hydrolase (TIGR01509 family)|uniref:Haloacid dehalogenase superfamily, subfamily IA, variant 3 with third motif having DD or ED n=1 Tax=Methanolobus vulcani TaxID=38026 RepID=A0A7Z7AV68_9EURY|nr:HAD family phosphatase [Methanolobus vulcani]MDK2826083.1 beta-phosphoglucomutase [Methanolobus sp.]MDK2948417.1 beta-phosphoglucomutase [Methanolobus sp.]SDF51744.1 haloacid dehalogenase superfamily, subfamily IA, variant 3 with third motif having DD or ED [Methanolobus vulcani]
MLSSLIFDMDGVLVDSMPYHAEAWMQVSREVGANVTSEDIYEIEGANHRLGLQWLFEKAGGNIDPDRYDTILQRKVEIFTSIADVKPFNGMADCLKAMKNNFRLAVVTGSERVTVESFMDQFFPGIFDVIVSGEDVHYGKPYPEPYLKAVELLDIEKEECLVVENAPMGVESAKRAGLYCVGVPTYVSPDKLSQADIVLEDHASLTDYLYTHLNNCSQ